MKTALLLLGLVVQQDGETPRLECTLERNRVYVGESVGYEVKVINVENPPAPLLDGFDGVTVETLGSQSFSNFFFINGRRSGSFGQSFSFRLTPLGAGVLELPAPAIEWNGQELRGTALRLMVDAPEQQSTVLLEVSAERSRVYPLQPFTVNLDVWIREVPAELLDGRRSDPLQLLNQPPALKIPWVEVPPGLQSDDLDRWLGGLLDRRGTGFTINNLSAGNDLFLFDRRLGVFQPEASWEEREVDGQRHGYRRYRLQRRFTPTALGEYRFGPAAFQGTVATGRKAGRLTGEHFYALSNVLTVTVISPPLAGRPESWTGAVGVFQISAALAPAAARVGDPMTLTLTVSGQGNLADIQAPALEALPAVSENFKVYDATSETSGSARLFSYGLRPLHERVSEFPAVPWSYFDPVRERYETVSSASVPMVVRAAESMAAGDIVSAPGAGSGGRSIAASNAGYFANFTDPARALERRLAPAALASYCAVLLAAYAALAFAVARRRRWRGDPALLRRRHAAPRARATLAAARRSLDEGAARRGAELLAACFAGYFADLSNRNADGLTPAEVDALAAQCGAGAEQRHELRALLEACDAARFGSSAAAPADLAARGAALLESLLAGARRQRRPFAPPPSAVLLLLLAAALAGCRRPLPPAAAMTFQDIQSDFLAAADPASFLAVAERIERLLAEHGESGALLYNLGNAYARAGDSGRAVAAYRRAQRFLPRDPYVQHNLARAQGAAPSLDSRARTLAGQLFFWKNLVSANELRWAVAGMATLSCAAAVTALLRPSGLAARLRYWLLGLTVLGAVSSFALERLQQPGRHGVVLHDGVIGRTGDSESYEPAFTEALTAATEFRLLEERNAWLHVRFPSGPEGWIPRGAALLY